MTDKILGTDKDIMWELLDKENPLFEEDNLNFLANHGFADKICATYYVYTDAYDQYAGNDVADDFRDITDNLLDLVDLREFINEYIDEYVTDEETLNKLADCITLDEKINVLLNRE